MTIKDNKTQDIDRRQSLSPSMAPDYGTTINNSHLDQLGDEESNKNEKSGGLFKTAQEKRQFIKRQVLSVALMLLIDVGLPLAIYYVLKMYVSQLVALILSGIPPLINVIVKFILRRKIDALGCIFVFSYVLSGILSVISGDARLALLRDSTVTCVVACAFLITLIPIKTPWFELKPLTYIVAQSFVSELPPVKWTDVNGEQQQRPLLSFLYDHSPAFRFHNIFMTLLWGICLMGEFISKLLMIKSTMSIDDIIWISNVIVIVVVVVNSVISTIGSMVIRRFSRARILAWKSENDFTEKYKSQQDGAESVQGLKVTDII